MKRSYTTTILKSQSGQTAVEYLLLLVAVVSILFAVFQTLDARFKADPEACQQGSINPLCFLKTIGIDGSNEVDPKKFRTFRLR
ncbi:Flp family type IVb pilin [Halobacteriovorax sp. XZX-3]|uniref:Flp family type IVb pilin n=1 Tax=unclassified Halobacteriovorax TaxID=2639665 RepID=UPI000CD19DDE|nr:Flp family type IVb pilin [Halobacteriovorax sp. DA5]POB14385.1 hypothetical protein C0Z22_04640 [Halobacteriovorax sp. DA5]